MALASNIIIVQGMRGSGKTNSMKGDLRECPNLFIVDIRDEYGHIPAIHSYPEFVRFAVSHHAGNGNGKLQLRINYSTRSDYVRTFHLFASLANCTILVDEADAIFSDKKFEDALVNVFLGSRNNKVNMYFAAKRPFLLPILVRSQADKYVIFRTEEERDINYLEGRIRKEFPKAPHTLNTGEAIIASEGQAPFLKRFPKFSEKE